MLMVFLKMPFLQSKTQDYRFLLSPYQQKTVQNFQNFLAKGLKDQCIAMKIKQKARTKIRKMNIGIFLDQTLCELIQIKITMLKGLKFEYIIYQKVLSRIIMSSSMEKAFISLLILI